MTIEPPDFSAAGIAAEDLLNERVLDELPVGVIVLDRHGFVVKYNRFEEQLARRGRQEVIGRHFFNDVAKCTNKPEVAGIFEEHIGTNTLAADVDYTFDLPFLPLPRDVRLRLRSFDVKGHIFGVIMVEDISLAKELERQRRRLLDVMVHDLRNPLQGILGYSSLLKTYGEKVSKEKLSVAIEQIEESASRMDDLLRGTLAEMHGERRKWQPINLHALVLSTLGNLLPAAKSKEIGLTYGGEPFFTPQFPDRAMKVHGAIGQLASLVQNLVGNAVKYATTQVRVDLGEGDGKIYLDVEDDGPGIATEDQTRIFERGFQAADSLPGSGIGLFSARRAVEAHDGRIELLSEPGSGCRFRVELPAG